MQRTSLNLDPRDMERAAAIVGDKGISKFVRDLMREKLDRLAPGDEKAGPPYFENNASHERRLTVSGRATVFAILRRKSASLDQLQQAFGIADPIDFLHALLGHRPLPDQAASVIVSEILGKLYHGE